MDSRCTTTHGPYRCEHQAGHAGDCETQSPAAKERTLEQRVRALEVQMAALQQRRQ